MLYDNIQYVNLLNNYLSNKENNYLKQKLIQTIKFINSEFIVKNNLLGSAYDADDEEEEEEEKEAAFATLLGVFEAPASEGGA